MSKHTTTLPTATVVNLTDTFDQVADATTLYRHWGAHLLDGGVRFAVWALMLVKFLSSRTAMVGLPDTTGWIPATTVSGMESSRASSREHATSTRSELRAGTCLKKLTLSPSTMKSAHKRLPSSGAFAIFSGTITTGFTNEIRRTGLRRPCRCTKCIWHHGNDPTMGAHFSTTANWRMPSPIIFSKRVTHISS